MPDSTCSIVGCDRKRSKRGWCAPHYRRWWTTGDTGSPVIPVGPGGRRKKDAKQRFLEHLPSARPTDGGCWEWRGPLNGNRYGRVFLPEGGSVNAHRFSYETFIGQIPDGMVVRHSCDNPPCCNPDHLSIGTQQDNMGDMIERGRKQTKLSKDDVRRIRILSSSDSSTSALASMFGVNAATIRNVVNRRTWKHVA